MNGIFKRRVFSKDWINIDESEEGGGLDLGNSICGITSYREASSGLPNECGVMETIPPGVKKGYLGPGRSFAGIMKDTPALAQLIPTMPPMMADKNGLAKMAPVIIGVGLLLMNNLKSEG